MESTGIYWRPIFNILEEHFEILLVNAQHVRNVPGHKTDADSAEFSEEKREKESSKKVQE